MKIAIPSNEKSIDGLVSETFGRAKYFIIYDMEAKEFSVIDNEQNLNAPMGAGIQSAKTIIDSGALVLITGHCGPKAFNLLSSAKVEVITNAMGRISEIIEDYKLGKFRLASGSDVEGHWH